MGTHLSHSIEVPFNILLSYIEFPAANLILDATEPLQAELPSLKPRGSQNVTKLPGREASGVTQVLEYCVIRQAAENHLHLVIRA